MITGTGTILPVNQTARQALIEHGCEESCAAGHVGLINTGHQSLPAQSSLKMTSHEAVVLRAIVNVAFTKYLLSHLLSAEQVLFSTIKCKLCAITGVFARKSATLLYTTINPFSSIFILFWELNL